MLVATELMRRGVDIAYPAVDNGVDLIAFRRKRATNSKNIFVPIQIKTRFKSGYSFHKSWFTRVTDVVLVQVWWISEDHPDFYILKDLDQVEDALGDYALSPSWSEKGAYSVTTATEHHDKLMRRHQDKWDRIIDQLPPSTTT